MIEHRLFPFLLILGAGTIWGGIFTLVLIATAGGAHPLGLSAWQVVLTAMFFLAACLLGRVSLFRLKNLRHYLVLALVGITVPNLLYYYAAPDLSAGILAITISSVPLFTYAIMLVLRFESLVTRRLGGILLGMIAILLLVIPDQGHASGDAEFWILLILICALLYAVENVYLGRAIPPEIDIRELLFASNLIACLIQFPLAVYLGVDEAPVWLFSSAGLAIGGIAFGSAIAYTMFFYSVKTSGPVFASQCAYVVTISGVIWGIIVFSEQHTLWIWTSVIVMLLGLFLVKPDDGDQADEVSAIASTKSSF